jgi:S-adenosylmethionine decarboxylase
MTDTIMARLDEEVELKEGWAVSAYLADTAVKTTHSENDNLTARTDPLDFFIRRDGCTFAGMHVIVDLWGAQRLDDPQYIEAALVRAAKMAGAHVLSTDFHHFQPNGGVSGVIVLSESHISIHTWPERDFAAVDIFMCGDARPLDTVPVLREAFSPDRVGVQELRRGMMD